MLFKPSLALAPVFCSRLVLPLFWEFTELARLSMVGLMPEFVGVFTVPLVVVALGLAAEPWPVDEDCAYAKPMLPAKAAVTAVMVKPLFSLLMVFPQIS